MKFRVLDECQVCKQNEVIFRPERNGKNTPLSHKWGTGHNFVPVVVLENPKELITRLEALLVEGRRAYDDADAAQEAAVLSSGLSSLVGELKKGGVE